MMDARILIFGETSSPAGRSPWAFYEIVGTKKRGLEVPKALAEEILPESVMEQAAQDGENLCLPIRFPTPSLRTPCWNRNLLLIRRQRPVWTLSDSLMMWPMIRPLNRLFSDYELDGLDLER